MINDHSKRFPERLNYKETDDSGYKGPLIFISGSMICCLFFILNLVFLAALFLIITLGGSILYYIYKPRHCEVCKQRMQRFTYEDSVYFCCDKDRRIFKLLIKSGD